MNNAYQKLYLTCFTEDTVEDAEHLFKNVFSKAVCVDRKENGMPIAMLFLMDCELVSKTEVLPYYYLYAACTHPNFRGKGIMRELLEQAKQVAVSNGKKGVFLKPANPPLFTFYRKSGFLPFFKTYKLKTTAIEFISAYNAQQSHISITTVPYTMENWYRLRKNMLPNRSDLFAVFPKGLFLGATDGCLCLGTNSGAGVVYEERDDTLLIKEALCPKNEEQQIYFLIFELLSKSNCSKLEIRLPESCKSSLFISLGATVEDFSVIWSDTDFTQDFVSPYHGFAFD